MSNEIFLLTLHSNLALQKLVVKTPPTATAEDCVSTIGINVLNLGLRAKSPNSVLTIYEIKAGKILKIFPAGSLSFYFHRRSVLCRPKPVSRSCRVM